MLVFEERGKPEYPEKNLSEQGREPITHSTQTWRRRQDLNPGNIGGRRKLSPLRRPLLYHLTKSVSTYYSLISLFLAIGEVCCKAQYGYIKHYWGNQNDPHSPPPFPLTTYEKGSRIRGTVRRGIRKPPFQPSFQKRACSTAKISSTLLNTRFETIEKITCRCFLRPLYQERPYEQLLHNWIFPTRRARFQIIFNAITQDTFCYKYHQCDYSHRGT